MFSLEKCIPCQGGIPPLNKEEIKKFKNLVDNDWNVENDKKIIREFVFSDYQTGINFTNKVAKLAEEEDHHPEIILEWGNVTVSWWSHKIKGLHKNDFICASKTDDLFKE